MKMLTKEESVHFDNVNIKPVRLMIQKQKSLNRFREQLNYRDIPARSRPCIISQETPLCLPFPNMSPKAKKEGL